MFINLHSIGDVLQKMDQVQQYKFGCRTRGKIRSTRKGQRGIIVIEKTLQE